MMVGMMSAMATAMGSRPVTPPTNDTALTTISTMLLKHSLESSKTSMDDMLGTILKLKKLADDGGDDESEEKGSFVQDIMGAIPQLMKSIFPQRPPESLPSAAVPPVATATAPGNPGPAPEPQLTPVDKAGNIIIMLIQAAEAKADPLEIHDACLSLVSDEEYENVATFLEEQNWWEKVVASIPAVSPHKEWFTKMREIIISEPDEQTGPEEQSQPVIGVTPPRVRPKAEKLPKNGTK